MTGLDKPTDLMNNRGLIRAESDDAAFVKSDEFRAWLAVGLEQLS
jgi:hypothetical protein